MIKFFGKIRQRLAYDNKPGKYFRYAIGEILLIVIGIFIALQLNNWNENRKLKIKELKILNELHSDLIQNMIDIEDNISSLDQSTRSNEIIKDHIVNQLPYNDSLDYHFSNLACFVAFTMNQTTYDNLKQIGMDIVSNDSLRFSISDLYGYRYVLYKTFEDQYLTEHFVNNIKQIYISEFSTFDNNSFEPTNYNQLINHPQLKQIINYSIYMYTIFSGMQSRLLNRIEKLKDEIEIENKNLKNKQWLSS